MSLTVTVVLLLLNLDNNNFVVEKRAGNGKANIEMSQLMIQRGETSAGLSLAALATTGLSLVEGCGTHNSGRNVSYCYEFQFSGLQVLQQTITASDTKISEDMGLGTPSHQDT